MPAQFNINDISNPCSCMHFPHSTILNYWHTIVCWTSRPRALSAEFACLLVKPARPQVTKSLFLLSVLVSASPQTTCRSCIASVIGLLSWASMSKLLLVRLTMNWQRRIALDDLFQSGLLHIQI